MWEQWIILIVHIVGILFQLLGIGLHIGKGDGKKALHTFIVFLLQGFILYCLYHGGFWKGF